MVEVWWKEQGVLPLNVFMCPVVLLGFRMECVEGSGDAVSNVLKRNCFCLPEFVYKQLVKRRRLFYKLFNHKKFVTHHGLLQFCVRCPFVVIYPFRLSSRVTKGQDMFKDLSMSQELRVGAGTQRSHLPWISMQVE